MCHNRLKGWLAVKRDKVEVQLHFVATTLKPLKLKIIYKNLEKLSIIKSIRRRIIKIVMPEAVQNFMTCSECRDALKEYKISKYLKKFLAQ